MAEEYVGLWCVCFPLRPARENLCAIGILGAEGLVITAARGAARHENPRTARRPSHKNTSWDNSLYELKDPKINPLVLKRS